MCVNSGHWLRPYLTVRRQWPPSAHTTLFSCWHKYYWIRGVLSSLNSDYVCDPFSTLVFIRNDQNMNSVLLFLPGQGWVQVSSRTIFLLPSIMGSTSVQNSSSTTLLKSSADPSLTIQEMFLVLVPSPHWASWNEERNN